MLKNNAMKTEVGVRAEVKYEKSQCCLICNKNNLDLKQKRGGETFHVWLVL